MTTQDLYVYMSTRYNYVGDVRTGVTSTDYTDNTACIRVYIRYSHMVMW